MPHPSEDLDPHRQIFFSDLVDVWNPFAIARCPIEPQLHLPADIERLVESARLLELQRKGTGAPATLRAYLADWTVFLQ